MEDKLGSMMKGLTGDLEDMGGHLKEIRGDVKEVKGSVEDLMDIQGLRQEQVRY